MDAENRSRRRREARRDRQSAAPRERLRSMENPFPPIEVLNAGQLDAIDEAAFQVLEKAGLEIRSQRARDILRDNGASVDDETEIVCMGRDEVRHFVSLAPSEFRLYARNPDADAEVGGARINFSPVGGAPNVSDLDRGRRPGDIETHRDLVRLNEALGVTSIAGSTLVEPVELPVETRHLDIYLANAVLTDRPWNCRAIGRESVEDSIDMSAIAQGRTREDLIDRPSVMGVINTNSPRRADMELLEGLMTLAEWGQVPVVTPFTLAGAMSPVTLAGSLVQQTAEALGIIALSQMVRAGSPVVMGGFTSNVDMKSGAPVFGTPEYVKATLAGGQIARRYGLPYRSSGVNASNCVDAQAVHETSMSLFAAVMGHANVVNHSAGWLEGGLVASLEKTVVDADLLRSWAEIMKPIATETDDLAVDTILGVPPGGHFFGTEHTLARYADAFHEPLLADWRNFETWQEDGARTATERANTMWKQLLADFQPPPIDAAIKEELESFVERRKREIAAA